MFRRSLARLAAVPKGAAGSKASKKKAKTVVPKRAAGNTVVKNGATGSTAGPKGTIKTKPFPKDAFKAKAFPKDAIPKDTIPKGTAETTAAPNGKVGKKAGKKKARSKGVPKDEDKTPTIPKDVYGYTGDLYTFKEILQKREHYGRIWLATCGQHSFIMKDIPPGIFEHPNEYIRPNLRDCPFIRVPIDIIPDHRIYVFNYLKEDFLSLVKKQIPLHVTKKILKDSLRGLAEMHSLDIAYLDMRAENILVDFHDDDNGKIVLEKVQITDLDDAAHLRNGKFIEGVKAGNENWRSPEAFFKSKLSKPTDMFSFGIVCIYAVLGRVILAPDAEFKQQEELGVSPDMIRLQRLVSYFGDQEGLDGLKTHLGDNETSLKDLNTLWGNRYKSSIPYKPFAEWPEVEDAVFKDLILRLMNLDPSKRITARATLEHAWFKDVD